MNILAVDQARHGAWAVFDYERKVPVDYGTWGFESKDYTFEQAILCIEALIDEVIRTHEVSAIFFEDIQLRRNVQSFKKLIDHPERSGFVPYMKWFDGDERTAVCHLEKNYRGWISQHADDLSYGWAIKTI